MGVYLTANNSKYSFKMSYIGFHHLRKSIAELLDPEFGELYHEMVASIFMKDKIEAETKLTKILADREKFPDEILYFLMEPDTGGSVSYRTCKKIYDLIKDVDFGNNRFQYVCNSDSVVSDYELFKKFLKDCYSHHRNMKWF